MKKSRKASHRLPKKTAKQGTQALEPTARNVTVAAQAAGTVCVGPQFNLSFPAQVALGLDRLPSRVGGSGGEGLCYIHSQAPSALSFASEGWLAGARTSRQISDSASLTRKVLLYLAHKQ